MTVTTSDKLPYRWRNLTDAQREQVVAHRRRNGLPWHSLPHYVGETGLYLITAACYEHAPIIGESPQRMADFESSLFTIAQLKSEEVFAWNVLPNHYHLLVRSQDLKGIMKEIGLLHGRTSFTWNNEDDRRGRKTWFGLAETEMKSERHFWATLNYVLHNAVKHGYAKQWSDWPYSNAEAYLAEVGRDEAERRWREHPVFNYGNGWDPAEM